MFNLTSSHLRNAALASGALLLVPLILTLANPLSRLRGGPGGGFDWMPGSFLVMGAMLFAAILGVQAALKHAGSPTLRIALVLAILAAFGLIWIELAVDGVSQLAISMVLPCPASTPVDADMLPVRLAIAR